MDPKLIFEYHVCIEDSSGYVKRYGTHYLREDGFHQAQEVTVHIKVVGLQQYRHFVICESDSPVN